MNIREAVGRTCAAYYRIRHRGRVAGPSYIMRTPSLVRVGRSGAITIGAGTVIEKGARIVAYAPLTIGEGVYIGKNATIVAYATVTIGDRALIAENVSIHSEDHGPAGRRDDFISRPIDIAEDTWLCAGVVVTKGVQIGRATTVGANAVVTRNLPAGVLATGAPATVVRQLTDAPLRD